MTKYSALWGALLATLAHGIWGIAPVYWKNLLHVAPFDILAFRTVLSIPVLFLLILVGRQLLPLREAYRSLLHSRSIWLSTVLVGANWFIFVWAVNSNKILQVSLGYFILPLVSVFLGVVLLKEKLSRPQIFSIVLAALGVLVLTVQSTTGFPYISFLLAFTFGFYSLIRKQAKVNALCGLFVEVSFLSIPFLLYLFYREYTIHTVQTASLRTILFLAFSGLFTCLPLFMFTQATRLLPLSLVSYFQYIGPSLQLVCGAILYKEPFTQTHLIAFSCIWIALAILSFFSLKKYCSTAWRSRKV